MNKAAIWFATLLLLLAPCSYADDSLPAWAESYRQGPPTAEETRAFMKELAQFVIDHHLKRQESPQRGMVYEYCDMTRLGQFDQFVQGEALDTMHDGAWLAAAMVNAYRSTGDDFYKQFLSQWQLPFYLKMLNHSDELFGNQYNHARADRQATWSNSKEWLLQAGEKGFVPYFWDDGGSVSLEMRNTKTAQLSFPGFDHFAHTNMPNPQYRLHGYSLGSSNHMAQDLGVMLQQTWLLFRESSESADQSLAREIALAAKHLHECRMRHHGYIPMCVAPAALCNDDQQLMQRVPAQDTWPRSEPNNHYVQALYNVRPGQRVALPGFADDQQYRYYYGLARHADLPEPLAFQVVYGAYTAPLLYRYYSDDAPVPPGINRFDLHPYYCIDGKLADYRSDRKGPGGRPRPIGSRMGPQNMICTGWALQILREYPGLWERRCREHFGDDVRVYIIDPPPSETARQTDAPQAREFEIGNCRLQLSSTRHALRASGTVTGQRLVLKLFSRPDGQGSHAVLALAKGQQPSAVNDQGQPLQVSGSTKAATDGFVFSFELPYTVVKQQRAWANGIEYGRYSIQAGDALRNYYLASDEQQVIARLRHELSGGLRTWQAIFDEFGYLPTGIEAGSNWQNFSDSGGYAHLISAASQWLLYLAGACDWDVHQVPGSRGEAAAKEQKRIQRWEPQIRAFEEQDAKNPPPRDAVLFVGSSSIRLWKLAESFPNMATINRGFGGSQLADSLHYMPRIVTPHRPRVVVLYAGDNDLAASKTPEQVAADFEAFVTKLQQSLPKTKLLYIGIKPSLARWKLIEQVREANRRIREIAGKRENVVFIDVEPPMLDDAGQPRSELFAKDGLHLSPAGYKLWTSLIVPHL